MDFFKSVFSPQPPPPPPQPDPNDEESTTPDAPPSTTTADGGAWGSFIRTLATRSESVIQTYRRDLEEFGSALRKETSALRDAVENIITHNPLVTDTGSLSPRPSTRFGSHLLSLQSDESTFLDDPPDQDDFRSWSSSFDLAGKAPEIDRIRSQNPVLEGILLRLVPETLDSDTFWRRYFYKVQKLSQVEEVRSKLVSRSHQEEELSWEVDDDEEMEVKDSIVGSVPERKLEPKPERSRLKGITRAIGGGAADEEDETLKEADALIAEGGVLEDGVVKDAVTASVPSVEPPSSVVDGRLLPEDCASSKSDSLVLMKVAEGVSGKEKVIETCEVHVHIDKKVDVPTSIAQVKDEDLSWDEIEDLGENSEVKDSTSGGNVNPSDLRKRLLISEDDEDLSWDVEDD